MKRARFYLLLPILLVGCSYTIPYRVFNSQYENFYDCKKEYEWQVTKTKQSDHNKGFVLADFSTETGIHADKYIIEGVSHCRSCSRNNLGYYNLDVLLLGENGEKTISFGNNEKHYLCHEIYNYPVVDDYSYDDVDNSFWLEGRKPNGMARYDWGSHYSSSINGETRHFQLMLPEDTDSYYQPKILLYTIFSGVPYGSSASIDDPFNELDPYLFDDEQKDLALSSILNYLDVLKEVYLYAYHSLFC